MGKEQGVSFERTPRGKKRFFSSGHLDALLSNVDENGLVHLSPRLWVRTGDPSSSLKSAIEYAFVREDVAKQMGDFFSQKVVITGVVPSNKINIEGGMNDEAEYIEGPVLIDGAFLITGEFKNPVIENITSQVLSPRE